MKYKIVRTIKRSKGPTWTYYLLYCIDPTVYEPVTSALEAKKKLELIEDVVKDFKVSPKKSPLGLTSVLRLARLVKKKDYLELRNFSNTLYLKFKIEQYE